MQLNIGTIQTTTDIPECITIHKPEQATSQDEHLQHIKDHIIQICPESQDLNYRT